MLLTTCFLCFQWQAVTVPSNFPHEPYKYKLSVYTGLRKDAGTQSRVYFTLSGEEHDTGTRMLVKGHSEVMFNVTSLLIHGIMPF